MNVYRRRAVSRIAVIVAVVVILIVAAGVAYYVTLPPSVTTTTTTATSTATSTSTSTSTATVTAVSTVTSTITSSPTISIATTSAPSVGPPVYGGTLIADEEFEPATVDPATSDTVAGLAIVDNVADGLVGYNWTTETIIPRLATAWTVSPDGLTYNFTLRQGVYFVNPATNKTIDEFNATDVQYSFNRVLGQANGYVFATAGLNMSTFHIYDPYHFSVSLSAPFSAFISTLADPYNAIIDKSVDLAHGGTVNGTVNSFMESNLVGTGPYMMTQWVKGDHITLMRNPYYWGAKPYLDRIVIDYRNDPSTRLLDLKGGAVQVASIDPNLIPSLAGSPNIKVQIIGLSDNIAPIGLDVQRFPTNSTLVRLAMAHAINYTFIDKSILNGFGISYAGPMPKGMFGYNDSIAPYQYNVTLAEQELAQAGYANGNFKNGTALPAINFVYPLDWPSGALVASAIQSDLSVIGLQVNIVGATDVSYGDYVGLPFNSTQRPQLLAYFWTPDFQDPADYATPSAAYNWNDGYSNPQIEKLGTEALSTFNLTLRAELYSQIMVLTEQACPIIWNYQYVGYAVYTTHVHGLIYSPLLDGYGFDWATVWLSGS